MEIINIELIKKHRASIMGLSIIAVMLFHFSSSYDNIIVRRFLANGYLGVDVFFLLSGFGLCYSYSKCQSLKLFLKKRIIRIVPTWWFLLLIMEFRLLLFHNTGPCGFLGHFLYYSGLGWWVYPFTNNASMFYEWYIPTLLLFYLVFPFLYKSSNKTLVLCLIFSMALALGLSFLNYENTINYSYNRLPVFIYGIFLYRYHEQNIGRGGQNTVILLFIIGTLLAIFVFGRYFMNAGNIDMWVHLSAFMFLLPYILTFIAKVFSYTKICNSIFSWLGTFTLELYLFHSMDWPFQFVRKYISNDFLSLLVASAFCILSAYLIHKLMSLLNEKLLKIS